MINKKYNLYSRKNFIADINQYTEIDGKMSKFT